MLSFAERVMGTGAFEQLFSELADPRQSAKVAHLFTDICEKTLCAPYKNIGPEKIDWEPFKMVRTKT